MYVRWVRRKGKMDHARMFVNSEGQWETPCKVTLYAKLVENKRVNGKPRQRVVKYLGRIAEDHVQANESEGRWARDDFWDDVDIHLNALKLDTTQRAQIEASLAAVVPMRPSSPKTEKPSSELAALEASISQGLKRKM